MHVVLLIDTAPCQTAKGHRGSMSMLATVEVEEGQERDTGMQYLLGLSLNRAFMDMSILNFKTINQS